MDVVRFWQGMDRGNQSIWYSEEGYSKQDYCKWCLLIQVLAEGGGMKERETEVTGQLISVLKAETDTNVFHSL